MKELSGAATAVTSVPVGECVRFLATVDQYPAWCPEVVREAEVMERNAQGDPVLVRSLLHMARGPLVRDFDVVLEIAVELGNAVKLTRVADEASDRERLEMTWRVDPAAPAPAAPPGVSGSAAVSGGTGERQPTRISLGLEASLSLPRLLPLAGIGDGVAETFCTAATRALGSSYA